MPYCPARYAARNRRVDAPQSRLAGVRGAGIAVVARQGRIQTARGRVARVDRAGIVVIANERFADAPAVLAMVGRAGIIVVAIVSRVAA